MHVKVPLVKQHHRVPARKPVGRVKAVARPNPAEIRAGRKQAGLTQEQAAALMKWAVLRWGRKERGEVPFEQHEWKYFLHVAGLERLPFRSIRKTSAELKLVCFSHVRID
jgi:hypothetical protein